MSGDVQASRCQGHLLVAWRDSSGVAAVMDGHKLAVSATTRGTPAVACGLSSFLIVWPSEDFGVDGRRVGFDGALLAPVTLFRGAFGASEVAAAYGDGSFLVAWADGVTIRALRVSDAGTVLDAARDVGLTGPFVSPRVVWTGSRFFLAWAEDRTNPLSPKPTRFWGARVSAEGQIEAAFQPLIEAGAGLRGLQPSMTTSGDRITFAWVAEHGALTCVDVAQVSEAGALLVPPRPLRCSDDTFVPALDEAEVRWSRGELVLVWRELKPDFTSALRVMRLDPAATPKETAPFAVLAERAWGQGLTADANGVAAVYFAAFAPPQQATVGVFASVIEQEKTAGRRRAVRR